MPQVLGRSNARKSGTRQHTAARAGAIPCATRSRPMREARTAHGASRGPRTTGGGGKHATLPGRAGRAGRAWSAAASPTKSPLRPPPAASSCLRKRARRVVSASLRAVLGAAWARRGFGAAHRCIRCGRRKWRASSEPQHRASPVCRNQHSGRRRFGPEQTASTSHSEPRTQGSGTAGRQAEDTAAHGRLRGVGSNGASGAPSATPRRRG